jgi:hypothetical protein
MTDDPRSHQYNDANWEQKIRSAQSGSATKAKRARHSNDATTPSGTDGSDPNNQHKSDEESGRDGSDRFGIPVQYKKDFDH